MRFSGFFFLFPHYTAWNSVGPILFPLKSITVTTELRALELLHVCVLCRFQDAFNLAAENLDFIVITLVW